MRTSIAAIVLLAGCQDGVYIPPPPPPDAGTQCPANAPDREGMMGPCCQRASNVDRIAGPDLRVAAVTFTEPTSLASVVIGSYVNDVTDAETFNWLFRFNLFDGSVRTGGGVRMPGGTFRLRVDEAPGPWDPARWNPVRVDGLALDGETLSGGLASADLLTLPMFDGEDLVVEIPFRNFRFTSLTFSEDRSCVGSRSWAYRTNAGEFAAFVPVVETDRSRLQVAPLNTTFCLLIGGMSGETDSCAMHPDATMWFTPPDSICDDAGACATGGCVPSTVWPPAAGTCNAWHVVGGLAAQGVEIVE